MVLYDVHAAQAGVMARPDRSSYAAVGAYLLACAVMSVEGVDVAKPKLNKFGTWPYADVHFQGPQVSRGTHDGLT
jgi:hypothetical protein